MPLKAGARINTPLLEANKIKSYEDTPSTCCGELHLMVLLSWFLAPDSQSEIYPTDNLMQ